MKTENDIDRSKIAALREAWIEAVNYSDANAIAALVTDDVVGIYGSGRCTCGKNELKTFLLEVFQLEDVVERTYLSSEVIIHGKWAIETDYVDSSRAPLHNSGGPITTHFRFVFVYCRQSDASWKVARVIELPD